MARIAMQTTMSAATPHHTCARRCVIVWAMKSLMRMNNAPFNTNQPEDANAVAETWRVSNLAVGEHWQSSKVAKHNFRGEYRI